ncbi:MAG: pyridoxal phosphate-dependent aminotransferase [Ignavibacteria bacterium]|nr:pyridoxal phosphate-dependent aminotransferase [Ignavibacteria bacterium]
MKPLSRKVAAVEESQTIFLASLAKKMKSEGIDVSSLTAGEPDFGTPQAIKDAAMKAIQSEFTKYTPTRGIPDLLKAVAEKFRKDNDLHFETSQVMVSNGAKHSIYNALEAICNKGDEVIIPAPYWVSYPEMAKLVNATPVIVKTSASNQFKMTPSQLRKALTKKSKVLIFCSPSNPTGAVYTQEEIEAIADVVHRSGIYVISDEIYEKIIYDGLKHFSMGAVDPIRNQVVTTNGVSKAYSMTGWRIGFMGGPKEIISAAEKVQSQVTSNACSISQKAALAALTADLDAEVAGMVREFDRRRQYLVGEFKTIKGIDFIYPRGSFTFFINVKPFLNKKTPKTLIKTTDDLSEYFLYEHRVATVPGPSFGAPHWIRLSYACSMEELSKGVNRLREGFAYLSTL